jgi:hypothetical protein
MPRLCVVVTSGVLLLAATPCAALEPGVFHIVESGPTQGGTRYLAEASVGTETCEFEIVLGSSKAAAAGPFAFATAAIIRRPGTDCTSFIKGLAHELGFRGKRLPAPSPTDKVAAGVVVLGVNQSRASKPRVAGGFSSQPPGSWTVTKLFLADGKGEVFLNLNAAEHIGEFSVKDEDYATIVTTELAKVLLRRG